MLVLVIAVVGVVVVVVMVLEGVFQLAVCLLLSQICVKLIKFILLFVGLFIYEYTYDDLLGQTPVSLFMSTVETDCHLKHISVTAV
jgi:hypothetical protein